MTTPTILEAAAAEKGQIILNPEIGAHYIRRSLNFGTKVMQIIL
jgi:hypothetical protein